VARWYFNWTTRLMWAFLMMFTGGAFAAGPLALLFHRLDPPSAVGYLVFLPFAVAFFRGMTLGFKTSKLGIEVRNPWRNYRFAWSEVAAITDFQPGALKGAVCPALRVTEYGRLVPLCGLAAWTRRGEDHLSRVFWLWRTIYPVRVEPRLIPVVRDL
jgi:hypothetical protein